MELTNSYDWLQVSFWVLSKHDLDMTPNFRHLLKMLAAFDANFLIFTILLFSCATWSTTYVEVPESAYPE
jgi:hypothetical protein